MRGLVDLGRNVLGEQPLQDIGVYSGALEDKDSHLLQAVTDSIRDFIQGLTDEAYSEAGLAIEPGQAGQGDATAFDVQC